MQARPRSILLEGYPSQVTAARFKPAARPDHFGKRSNLYGPPVIQSCNRGITIEWVWLSRERYPRK